MALIYADRVQETTATTGTGTISLLGAATQFQSFSAGIGNANTCDYCILSGNGTDWETGNGTYTSSGSTLSRTKIFASTNSGSAISLSGTSTVFGTLPAHRVPGHLYDITARVPALSSFTQINISSTSSVSENSGLALSIIDTGKSATALAGLTLAVPVSTPYRVAILLLGTTANTSSTEYCWGWSDGTKFDTLGSSGGGLGAPTQESWTNSTTRSSFAGVTPTLLFPTMGYVWLGLHDDGTNRIFEVSGDGANYETVLTTAKSSGFLGSSGYTNIFFGLRPSGAVKGVFSCLCYDVNGLTRVVGF